MVVVGQVRGDWAEEAAQQRARALEAIATADGLGICPGTLLIAQYNVNFQSPLRVNEALPLTTSCCPL